MARSRREPSFYICYGATPRRGKQHTSRRIRRAVRQALRLLGEEFDFTDPADRNRGRAGSRDADSGWLYFGDGRVGPHRARRWMSDEAFNSLRRK